MTSGMDWSPLLGLLGAAALLATGVIAVQSWRLRGATPRARLAALTALTAFLTFDLIVFGAFTRLSDSGLGCPDWPGCYGEAHPQAAAQDIAEAQADAPHGPVTFRKAWIEMIHRYLAMTVGALITVIAVASVWLRRQLPHRLLWPWVTLAWVIVQGLFGAFTVTLKLYPAIVTLHLVGGLMLLALLVVQQQAYAAPAGHRRIAPGWTPAALGVLAVVTLQVFLGGWVSTNYAVLACQGFPSCSGQWWPDMNFEAGFSVLRHLGRSSDGGYLPVEALVAIHWTHRLFAIAVAAAVSALAWRLWITGRDGERRLAGWLLVLLVAQLATGLSNVVLGWPLVAALLHTAGAAGLVAVLVVLAARSHYAARQADRAPDVVAAVNPGRLERGTPGYVTR